ncbi:MAG: alpha/beta hydrolase [Burkholderiaceae bacterium]|nr:alpha/beta hydrolase [Burkholderiaceae bacterium]
MPSPDAHALRLIDLDLPGLRLHAAVQGEGPLVILCHGFPEGWRSWRHQLAALAAAGYRAVAPDLRGYGGTEAPGGPLGPEQTTMLHHAGDLVALVKALGETQAVLVGHDWGAPTVWYAALMRPDVFRAVAGLSVPFVPPSPVDLLAAYARQGVDRFYMQYFQAPGVAEAELDADPEATLRRVWWSMSGDGPGRVVAGVLPPGAGFLDVTEEPDPARVPAWWHADDLQATAEDFRRRGFVGGLNWYRAIRRNAELLAPWYGAVIRQPSLFIVGERDDLLAFPGVRERLQDLRRALPGLRGQHVLPGAGHWVQRERADEVSRLLVDFLRGLDGPA